MDKERRQLTRMGIKLDINGSQKCPCGIQMEVQSGQKKEADLDATGETRFFFYDKKFMIKSPLGLRKKSIKGVSERHETQVPKTC